MIVAETPDAFRFVTQPDHAALAGRFADHWGNEAFERPEPNAAVRLAAHRHDDGWWPYDRRPHLGDGGGPLTFTELPAETWIELYDAGIDDVVGIDPYAGLLVSMHGTGLRRRRYGLSPSWPDAPPAFAGFVGRQEALQSRLASELAEADPHGRVSAADVSLLSSLHETGSASAGSDSRLWRNYRLLQAWDTLSLSFCTTVSPPGYGDVGPVPTREGRSETTLAVEPLGDGEFRVEPFPFDADPLVASVPARTVPRDAIDGEAGLVRTYYAATLETETFALRAGRA